MTENENTSGSPLSAKTDGKPQQTTGNRQEVPSRKPLQIPPIHILIVSD
jgi:hypothetical protein